MKKIFVMLLLSIALLSTPALQAQENPEQPTQAPWVSAKGYWVLKSSKQNPKDCLVYYYNNQNQLIGQHEVKNQRMNLQRKKTLLQLKTMLEEAVARHEKGRDQQEDIALRSSQQ